MPAGRPSSSGADDRRLEELHAAIRKCKTLCDSFNDDEYGDAPEPVQHLLNACRSVGIALSDVKWLFEQHPDVRPRRTNVGLKLDECSAFIGTYRAHERVDLNSIGGDAAPSGSVRLGWQDVRSNVLLQDERRAAELEDILKLEIVKLVKFLLLFTLKRTIPPNSTSQSGTHGLIRVSSMPRRGSFPDIFLKIQLVRASHENEMRVAFSQKRSPSFAEQYQELEPVWHMLCVQIGLTEENGPACRMPIENLLEGPLLNDNDLLDILAEVVLQPPPVRPPTRNQLALPTSSNSSSSNQGASTSESSTPHTTPSLVAPPPPASHKTVNPINIGDPGLPTEIARISLEIRGKRRVVKLQSWESMMATDSHTVVWAGLNSTERLYHHLPPNIFPFTLHRDLRDPLTVTFRESHHLVFKSEDGLQHDCVEAARYVFSSPQMRTQFQSLIRGKDLIEAFDFEYLWSKRWPRKKRGEALLQVLKIWQDRQYSNRHAISFYNEKEQREMEFPILSFEPKVRREAGQRKVAYLDFSRPMESSSDPVSPPTRKSTTSSMSPGSKHKKSSHPKKKSVDSNSSGGNSDISEGFGHFAIEFSTIEEAIIFADRFQHIYDYDSARLSITQEHLAETDTSFVPIRRVDQPLSDATYPRLRTQPPSPLPSSDDSTGLPNSPIVLVASPMQLSPVRSPNGDRPSPWVPRATQTVVPREKGSFSDPSIVQVVKRLAPRILENKYVYSPLSDPSQIRLLVIQPAMNLSDPVYCEIVTSTITTEISLRYEALSYTWGTDDADEEIQVFSPQISSPATADQKRSLADLKKFWPKLYVRKNLLAAIRQLRRKQEEAVFWIDALCIDQDNISEKNAQVRMMAEIYMRATNVCIWLGEGSHESQTALEFIPSLLQGKNLQRFLKDETSVASWLAFATLVRNQWFSRRWVVQEVALAKSQTLHCGSKSLAWPDFAQAVEFFVANSDTINALLRKAQQSTNPLNPLGNVRTGAHVLVEALNNLFSKTEDGTIVLFSNLEILISTLLSFEATDPRDTIYSVLSLANDTVEGSLSRSLHQEALSIVPDYEKSFTDVFKEFIDFVVTSSKSLDIICRHWAPELQEWKPKEPINSPRHVQMSTRLLPSWIPPVSGSAYGTPVERLKGRMNGDSFVGIPKRGRTNYNATPRTKAICRFGKVWVPSRREITKNLVTQNPGTNVFGIYEGEAASGIGDPRNKGKGLERDAPMNKGKYRCNGSMFVKGFRLDVIDEISSRISQGKSIPRECLALGGYDVPQYGETIPAPPDQVWRTMVADRDSNGERAPTLYQRCVQNCLAISTKGDIDVDQLIQDDEDQVMVDFLKRVQRVVWNRRFMRSAAHLYDKPRSTTSPRHYFGLAPAGAKKNDIICILLGCSVPVILREILTPRHHFELIGEAYVYGIMDGEALGRMKIDELVEECEEFELR